MRFFLIAIALIFTPGLAAARPAQLAPIEPFLWNCEFEGIRIWGVSLCAPVVLVDQATGETHTSDVAPAVPLPPARANTAFDWGGRTWIMVLAPLPADPAQRNSLLFHEAFHVHQNALGFPSNTAVAGHFDDPIARYLARLEWTALERALLAQGAEQRRHIEQALAFRAQRLAAHPEAAAQERALMRHEGLATYTGAAASGAPLQVALADLRSGPSQQGLSRSFPYVNAAAWGLLLDRYSPEWKRSREARDLPDMMPLRAARVPNADAYGGTSVLLAEMAAHVERARRIAESEAATAQGRGLRLPLSQMSMNFDPNRVSSGANGATIYHQITLQDRWGRIAVDGIGLRFLSDFSAAYAAWPLPDGALQLAEGWRVEEQAGGGAVLVGPAG